MLINYYLDENNILYAHNENYDVLRVFNVNDNRWDRVTFYFDEFSHNHNLTFLNDEEVKKITTISPESSMRETIDLLKKNNWY